MILYTRVGNAGLATMLVSWRTFDETLRSMLIRLYQSQSSDTLNISVMGKEDNVRLAYWQIHSANMGSNSI
jgi:hypothetical protein